MPHLRVANAFLIATMSTAFTACGGGGGGLVDGAPVSFANYTSNPIIASQGNFLTTSLLNSGTVTTTNTGISFDTQSDYATASAQIDGVDITLNRTSETTWESGDGAYMAEVMNNLSGLTGTGDVYFLSLTNADGDVFVTTDGFNKADPPTTGTATYNGVVSTHGVNGSTASGAITLNVDFANTTGGLTGSLSGLFPGSPISDFDLIATDVPAQSEVFSTTLTSSDTTVTSSRITGQFYGANAAQLAGDLAVHTTSGDMAGHYDARR